MVAEYDIETVMDGHTVRFPEGALEWAKAFAVEHRAKAGVTLVPEYAALAGVCVTDESLPVLVVVGRATTVRTIRWEEESIGGLFEDEAKPTRERKETVDLGEARVYVFDGDVPDRFKGYAWRIPE